MATTTELFVPTSPTNFTFRPMVKGMITAATSVSMPDGSFISLKGLDVGTRGPKRHGGWEPGIYDQTSGLPLAIPFEFPGAERIEDIIQLWLSDGGSINTVLTNRCLYKMDKSLGYEVVKWGQEYTIDTVTVGTDTVLTVTGDFTDHYIAGQDYIYIGTERRQLTSATATETEMTLIVGGLFATTPVSGDKFTILKLFLGDDEYFVDWAFGRNALYLVDGRNPLVFKYEGEYLTPHIITNDSGTRTVMGARTIMFFGERLYFGDVIEYDPSVDQKYLRQRIRWTEILQLNISKSTNYQDLVRTQGRIVKLCGMGSLAIAYLDDGMYYGRQTNLTNLPYAFYLLETAGVTALGMKAVTTFFDGQVFAGQDNVYYISPDVAIQQLGTQIAEQYQASAGKPYGTYVRVDTDRMRVFIGTSTTGYGCDTFFFYNYRSKAWSWSTQRFVISPACVQFNDELYYYELSATDTYETTPYRYNSFVSLLASVTNRQFLGFQQNSYLIQYDKESNHDETIDATAVVHTSPIQVEIITPDFDFDRPDENKTALRVGMKINEVSAIPRTEQIRYKVESSIDRGHTWKYLGTMVIRPGYDEDALNFRVTGSTIRFRLTSGVVVDDTAQYTDPYEIVEITLRLRERSIETFSDNTRPTP